MYKEIQLHHHAGKAASVGVKDHVSESDTFDWHGRPGKTLESMRAKPKFDNEHTAKDPAVWKSEL